MKRNRNRKEKIIEMIDDKVNEIFYDLQEEENIKWGEIEPLDAFELDDIEEHLAELINRVIDFELDFQQSRK